MAAVGLSLLAILLGILFENQNIAFLVGLVFAIAASANFPVIILSVKWSGLTTRGAVCGALCGLLVALGLVLLSPAVWTNTLGLGSAIFPYDNPALFSVPLAFIVTVLVSVYDKSERAERDRSLFTAQHIKANTGLAT
jgi:cation/acetate symporter